MGKLDPDLLAELRRLVIDMATDIDDTRAAGYRTLYAGDELRVHFRALVRSRGLEVALAEARKRYQLQLAGDLVPLDADVPLPGPSGEHGGAR